MDSRCPGWLLFFRSHCCFPLICVVFCLILFVVFGDMRYSFFDCFARLIARLFARLIGNLNAFACVVFAVSVDVCSLGCLFLVCR